MSSRRTQRNVVNDSSTNESGKNIRTPEEQIEYVKRHEQLKKARYLTETVCVDINVDDGETSNSDESSDSEVLFDEEKCNSDEEVIKLQNNYNNIASKIVIRDKQYEVNTKLSTVVKDVKVKQLKVKTHDTVVPPLKDLVTSPPKDKKKVVEINDVPDTEMCSDVADLIRLGIRREIRCDNTIPQNVKTILTPNTEIVIPARYKCKTCGINKVFLGKHRTQRLFDNSEDCCKNLKSMAQRGLGFLSLSENCGRFMSSSSGNFSWGVYLQMWHSNRFLYCEPAVTDIKNCFNYEDGEFAIKEFQKLKASNYVSISYMTKYNNFHQIRNASNLCVSTTITSNNISELLESMNVVDINSQKEKVITLRRLYVRMVRIINDAIILINGQYEIPLMLAHEFTKIQIARTIIAKQVRQKAKINIRGTKLAPSEFCINELFTNTRLNIFEMIKKNNNGIKLYDISKLNITIEDEQKVSITHPIIRTKVNANIEAMICGPKDKINRKILFQLMVLKDDIDDCNDHYKRSKYFFD